MPNLRIVSRDRADRATLTASSEASADTAVANLKTNKKGDVWRATKTYAAIKAVLAEQATVGFVGLAFGNLSDGALVRRRVSNEASATNLLKESARLEVTPWGTDDGRGEAVAVNVPAPDGAQITTMILHDGGSTAYRYQTSTNMAAGSYTASIFVKKVSNSSPWIFLQLTNSHRVGFNLDTRAFVTSSAADPIVARVLGEYGGFIRIGITTTMPATWNLVYNVGLSTSAGHYSSGTAAYALGEGHIFWGAMLQTGEPSSYYPSADTFTSRASTATYIGSDGLIKTAAINAARMQYNPVDLNAPPKLLLEAAAMNVLRGSESFSTAHAWSSALNVTAATQTYKGVPYQKLAKTLSTSSEGRGSGVWSAAAGSVYTCTIALRADTAATGSIGLYDSSNGTAWGAASESIAEVISGPGAVSRGVGALFHVTGLSTTADTLVRVTRTYNLAGNASAYIYPGLSTSTTIGDAILATRAQVETAQAVYGAEKVTNGTFTTDTGGWQADFATLSVAGGRLRVTSDGSGSSSRASQSFTTVVGKNYYISVDVVGGTAAAAVGVNRNNTIAMSQPGDFVATVNVGVTTTITGTFTATGTATRIIVSGSSTAGQYVDFDNVTVKEFTLVPVSTSYIPTTTAAVTRAADVSSSAAGVRPAGYIDYWQFYDYDSGWVSARTVKAELEGFTDAQAASAYAYGGGSHSAHWLPKMLARGVSVDIKDDNNLQGYVEVSRLVIADYLEVAYNADLGASLTPEDTTKQYDLESGDVGIERGTKRKKLTLQLSHLTPTDREQLFRIKRSSGLTHPVWASLFPENANLALENDHQVFGYFVDTPAMAIPGFERYATSLTIKEI